MLYKHLSVIFLLSLLMKANAQVKKTYNTKIGKANNVNIITKKHVETEINYNTTSNKSKIYLLSWRDLSVYDSNKVRENTPQIYEMVFGDPDSLALHDVDFTIEFGYPYDSAHFRSLLPPNKEFSPFNTKSPIRDYFRTFSPDRKKINFKAGYIAAKKFITLIIYKRNDAPGSSMNLIGVGKLF